jgi:hypothetical protein
MSWRHHGATWWLHLKLSCVVVPQSFTLKPVAATMRVATFCLMALGAAGAIKAPLHAREHYEAQFWDWMDRHDVQIPAGPEFVQRLNNFIENRWETRLGIGRGTIWAGGDGGLLGAGLSVTTSRSTTRVTTPSASGTTASRT